MAVDLRRKTAGETMVEAAEWVTRNPILLLAFLVYGLFDLLGELLGPIGLLVSPASILVLVFFNGLAHVIGDQEATGASGDIGAAASIVLGRFVSLVGVLLVYGLAVVIGFLLLIAPGVYLAVRLALAFPACVIDDRDAVDSLQTSWDVASGNFTKLFGISIVSFGAAFGTPVVSLLFVGLNDPFYLASIAVGTLVAAIVLPIAQLSYARVYLENRNYERGGVLLRDRDGT